MKDIIYFGKRKDIISDLLDFLDNKIYNIYISNDLKILEACIRKNDIDLIIIEDSKSNLEKLKSIVSIKKLDSLDRDLLLVYKEENHLLDIFLTQDINDFIGYPFTSIQLNKKLINLLFPNTNNKIIKKLIKNQTFELNEVKSVMIETLSTLAEHRDNETGGHIKRTQNYVKALALELRKEKNLHETLTDEVIELMYLSVPLHDIGKVGIRDDILLKPGKLTTEEFNAMKLHTIIGHQTILNAKSKLYHNEFLKFADDVAYTHHEKWDGSGYPRGLIGEEIPLIGRLMAVADVYDALVSKRVYKEAFSHEDAKQIIIEGRGKHFDPNLVDIFLKIEKIFKKISIFYSDANYITEGVCPDFGKLDERIKTILIVDDQSLLLQISSNLLNSLGFKVFTALNGQRALDILKKEEIDLIITDLEMPEMNGFELTKIIRKRKITIPIIALTSANFEFNKRELVGMGFDDLMLKPLDIKILAKSINNIIAKF